MIRQNPGMKKEWLDNAALDKSDFQVAQKIATGLPSMAAFQPDNLVIDGFSLDEEKPLRLLDFGAGMLRNTVGLLERSPNWFVTAYDISPITLSRGIRHFDGRLRKHLSRYATSTNFDDLRGQKFDAIIAILTLQHIDPDPLREILKAFTLMTPVLCVYGRSALDDLEVNPTNWTRKWPIIQEFWTPWRTFDPLGIGQPFSNDVQAGDHFGAVFLNAKDHHE